MGWDPVVGLGEVVGQQWVERPEEVVEVRALFQQGEGRHIELGGGGDGWSGRGADSESGELVAELLPKIFWAHFGGEESGPRGFSAIGRLAQTLSSKHIG